MAEQTKSYYAVIPANVRYDKELTANAKLLYGEITALTNEKGYCWATNEYFANLYGVSNRTIINWINSLVDKEYLIKDIIYKDNSKQIVDRYLRLPHSEKNFTTSRKNLHDPSEKNFTTPSEKNFTYNNTISNNTINTTYKRESIGQSPTPVTQNKRFKRPNLEEVKEYCLERKNNIDAENFIDFYDSKGWKVGNTPMKDWKACVRTWEKKSFGNVRKTKKDDFMDRYEIKQQQILKSLENE